MTNSDDWQDAGLEVSYRYWCLNTAKDEISRATALIELNNSIHDLQTYLPGWDYETGTMPWERGEDSE